MFGAVGVTHTCHSQLSVPVVGLGYAIPNPAHGGYRLGKV